MRCVLFVIILLVSFAGALGQGSDATTLAEFPSVNRVLSEIRGADERDTTARQIGALRQLWHMVPSLIGGRLESPAESQLRQNYNIASGKLDRPVMASFDAAETAQKGMDSPRARWVALCSLYEHDEALRDEILTKFFSPSFRARWGSAIAAGHRVQRHSAAELSQNDPSDAPSWLRDLPWYKGPAFLLAGFAAVSLLWFVASWWRQLTRYRLHSIDPFKFLGKRTYEIHTWTGLIANSEKMTLRQEKVVRVDNPAPSLQFDPGRQVHVSVQLLHKFQIVAPDGSRLDVTLNHHDAPADNGERFSLVQFYKRKELHGDPLIYVNHDTGKRVHHRSLARYMRPTFGFFISGLLVLICAAFYAEAFAGYQVNRANFPTLFDYTGSIATNWAAIVTQWLDGFWYKVTAAVLIVWVVRFVTSRLRAWYFCRRGARRLFGKLEDEAQKQKSAGFLGVAPPNNE